MNLTYKGVPLELDRWMQMTAWERRAMREAVNEIIVAENDAIEAAKARPED